MKSAFYDKFMYPMETNVLFQLRKNYIPKARGKTLEVGSGTGANLPFYNFETVDLTVTDTKLSKTIVKKISSINQNFKTMKRQQFIKSYEADVMDLSLFENETFDTVVFTLVFCSVSNVILGLDELFRVLKPNGIAIFIEHVLPEKKSLKNIANIINPVWIKVAKGCNVNREFEKTIITKTKFKFFEKQKLYYGACVCGILVKT